VGDPDSVAAFYQQVPDSSPDSDGFYTFHCNSTLPDISFTIGNQDFPVTQTMNLGEDFLGSDRCIGGLRKSSDTPFWILGNIFMTNYYTVFDFENAQVGFATLATVA